MNRKPLMLLLGLTLFATPLPAKEKPSLEDRLDGQKITLARYAKSFVGAGNITVDVAPYKMDNGQEGAILLFKGVESSWDGKAVNHKVLLASRGGRDYVASHNGKDWASLTLRSGVYTLTLPDLKEEVQLTPSDGAAQLTTPQHILMQYNEQKHTK